MAKHSKQDAKLIAWTDENELDSFVKKMKKKGYTTTRDRVRELAREYNNSAEKVEAEIKHDNEA